MSGNTQGVLFCVTTFGESHGPVMGAIVDGCPPGLALSVADIQVELDRRKPGTSRYTSQRKEADAVKILSGVFEGVTTGTPIGLLIENNQQRSHDYDKIEKLFRPGHGDFSYLKKYGIRDHRGGGRASARETVMRVAAGAIAKKYLREKYHVQIRACVSQIGEMKFKLLGWDAVETNAFFCPEPDKIPEIENYIQHLLKAGDSVGAQVHVQAINVPIGLGEPVFAKLDAEIAHAMMGINAVKGVSIGDGFACVSQRGSQFRDEMTPQGFLSNHAGGILAGISTGQDILVDVAFKPASSIRVPGKTIDVDHNPAEIITTGRHDACVGLRAVAIVEAMLALVLMDHLLRNRAQNYDQTI